jgi:hypothetical protein
MVPQLEHARFVVMRRPPIRIGFFSAFCLFALYQIGAAEFRLELEAGATESAAFISRQL